MEQFCEDHDFTKFLLQQKFAAEVANGTVGKRQVMAVKPLTYMNKSGEAVQRIVDFYKIPVQDILVLQDEIDLQFGHIKLKYN
ncbi:MAG: hypothetical protein H6765_03190 [Candidatus Peribacteria bacterium]|nr:MAG: hypothetical protein H6765_03190 [Candidatus Peribacteria bacterium]